MLCDCSSIQGCKSRKSRWAGSLWGQSCPGRNPSPARPLAQRRFGGANSCRGGRTEPGWAEPHRAGVLSMGTLPCVTLPWLLRKLRQEFPPAPQFPLPGIFFCITSIVLFPFSPSFTPQFFGLKKSKPVPEILTAVTPRVRLPKKSQKFPNPTALKSCWWKSFRPNTPRGRAARHSATELLLFGINFWPGIRGFPVSPS